MFSYIGKRWLSITDGGVFMLKRNMVSSTIIPVVDFEGISSNTNLSSAPQIQQLNSAFTDVGAVYIRNHGIDKKLVNTDSTRTRLYIWHGWSEQSTYTYLLVYT